MTKLLTAVLGAAMLVSAPASAQTYVLVVGHLPEEKIEAPEPATLDQRMEAAIKRACDRPFIRDLKGWELYEECVEDAHAQLAARFAENKEEPVTLASN